jgi:hypothetical protein
MPIKNDGSAAARLEMQESFAKRRALALEKDTMKKEHHKKAKGAVIPDDWHAHRALTMNFQAVREDIEAKGSTPQPVQGEAVSSLSSSNDAHNAQRSPIPRRPNMTKGALSKMNQLRQQRRNKCAKDQAHEHSVRSAAKINVGKQFSSKDQAHEHSEAHERPASSSGHVGTDAKAKDAVILKQRSLQQQGQTSALRIIRDRAVAAKAKVSIVKKKEWQRPVPLEQVDGPCSKSKGALVKNKEWQRPVPEARGQCNSLNSQELGAGFAARLAFAKAVQGPKQSSPSGDHCK